MRPKLPHCCHRRGANRGSRARQYLETITRLTDHYELATICDRDPNALQEVATQYGVRACYENVAHLFDAEKLMLYLAWHRRIHISSLPSLQRDTAHTSSRKYRSALTRRYAAAIAETCQSAGVLWEVAEQVWLWPTERLKRQIIEAGTIGKLTHARLWYLTGQYHGFNGVRTLLGARATRLLGYCGEVETEPYIAYGGEPESTVKWDQAVIEFDNGVTCLFEKPPRAFPLREQTFSTGWQVEGTKGHLDRNRLTLYEETQPYDITEGYTEIGGERVLEEVRVDTTPPIVWENPFKSYRIDSSDGVARASILVSFHHAIHKVENRSTALKTPYMIGRSVSPSAKVPV